MPQNTTTERTNSYLYRNEAEQRCSVIQDVEYYIDLQFSDTGSIYQGSVKVHFNVRQPNPERLFLEFAGKHLHKLSFDDKSLSDLEIEEQWQHHRLILPEQWSNSVGSHTVQVTFENVYDNTGFGLFAFRDNNEVYIYSVFASNHAHSVFPCFDQPDIKGVFHLTVTSPAAWQVISNENTQHVIDLPGLLMKKWIFEATYPISTYLFCINTGNWYESVAVSAHKNIRTNFYCRQSCKERLRKSQEQLQKLIDFGLQYYEERFGVPFPFSKYDQIFCPEFNYSGMENPGAVELTEGYLFFENPSSYRMTQRALTIVHELCHMWFGDLVTMKWWKDIWLNEAFAVLMSYKCIDAIQQVMDLPFDDVWCKLLSYKEYGYEQDMNTFTHPVEVPVLEASESQENFDSITYSKGAAVLQQLVSLIGWNTFFTALNTYFKKYQWRNADMMDLFDVISNHLEPSMKQKFSMERWIVEWISTASLNEIMASLNQEDLQVKIHQAPHSKHIITLRQHCFLLTAYFVSDEKVYQVTTKVFMDQEYLTIDFNQLADVQQLKKQSKKSFTIAAVIMNQDDQGYFFNLFDRQSLLFFLKNFNICFQSDLHSKNFIKTLQQSCITGYSSSQKLFECYIDLIQQKQTKEVTQYKQSGFNVSTLIYMYYVRVCFRRRKSRVQQQDILDSLQIYNGIKCVLKHSIIQQKFQKDNDILCMMREYIGTFAQTADQIYLMFLWLTKQNFDIISDFKADSYILSSFLLKFFQKKDIFNHEQIQQYDKYWELYRTTAKYYRRIKEGAEMSLEELQDQFDRWITPNGLNDCSLYELEYLMQGINNENSKDYEAFERIYYENLPYFLDTKNKQFIKRFPLFHTYQIEYLRSFTLKMMELLKNKHMDSDDVDKMFYVKQVQEKIDFLDIKLQIQLSGSPIKKVQQKSKGFKIELL